MMVEIEFGGTDELALGYLGSEVEWPGLHRIDTHNEKAAQGPYSAHPKEQCLVRIADNRFSRWLIVDIGSLEFATVLILPVHCEFSDHAIRNQLIQ